MTAHRGWVAVNVEARFQLARYGDLALQRGAAQHSVRSYLSISGSYQAACSADEDLLGPNSWQLCLTYTQAQ